MNAREFLDLQDAYQGVYDEIDEELKPLPKERMERQAQRAYGKETRAAAAGDEEETNKQMQRRIAMQSPASRRNVLQNKKMDEETDVFTQVLEHLVAEGYADTNESALAIMANMSEEWRESIVEARVDDGKSKEDKRKIRTARAGRAGVNLPNSSLHTGDIDRRDAHRTADDLNKDAKDIRKGRLNLPQFQGTTGRERVAQVKKEKGIR